MEAHTARTERGYLVWQSCPTEVRRQIVRHVTERSAQVVEVFYSTLLEHPEASHFLDNRIVQERLGHSLQRWLVELFGEMAVHGEAAIHAQQQTVGEVHARINIPMRLVNRGMGIIKYELTHNLHETITEPRDLNTALLVINNVLDYALDSMHEAYLHDLTQNTRNQQSLQLILSGHQVAFEIERIKTSLFEWLNRLTMALYTDEGKGLADIPPFEHSDFALWLGHKADLIFGESPETASLRQAAEAISQAQHTILEARRQEELLDLGARMREINHQVQLTSKKLTTIVENFMKMEEGKDTLTRALNRRYLPSIFQRETEISIRLGRRFSTLMLDIDHFKAVNDTHGHKAGDAVIATVAGTLNANVRSSDFVFRYGGEEFLLLLAESDEATAAAVGEKLRRLIEAEQVDLGDGRVLSVTASVGVAEHDGHPDYERTIAAADEALYRAKNNGRNQVVCASQRG